MEQQATRSDRSYLHDCFRQSARNLGDQACGFLSGYWWHLKTTIEQQENTFRLAHEGLQTADPEMEEGYTTLTHYASNYAKGLLLELSVLEEVFQDTFPQHFQTLAAQRVRDDYSDIAA
jgi:hypothetical protein